MEFVGKVALITGASVGIGRAVAHLFAERGADLVLLNIDGVKLKAVYEELKDCQGKIKVYTCDVSNEEQVNEICNIITQTVKSSYYRRGYQIARMIVHKLGDPICFAECYFGKKRVFIKVSQYH